LRYTSIRSANYSIVVLVNSSSSSSSSSNSNNLKAKLIAEITEATRTISKSHKKFLSNIPAKQDIKKLRKTAMLGTANILRKVLM